MFQGTVLRDGRFQLYSDLFACDGVDAQIHGAYSILGGEVRTPRHQEAAAEKWRPKYTYQNKD